MKSLGTLLMIAMIIPLLGCYANYKAVATYGGDKEILIGNVEHNLSDGSASFKFQGTRSNLECNGFAERPYYIPPVSMCEGQRGRVSGNCSDGTTFQYEWEADSCYLSHGKGIDSLGNSF